MPEITREVGGALAKFFHGGTGPSHAGLDSAFAQAGCAEADPAPPEMREQARRANRSHANKETRVNAVFAEALRRDRGRQLTEELLQLLGLDNEDLSVGAGVSLRRALSRCGFRLNEEGYLEVAGETSVVSHANRPAIEYQLARLRRADDDPGLMIGTAKEMLESTAKYVLEELGSPVQDNVDFGQLLYRARERLRVRPEDIAAEGPETQAVKKILGSAATIAEQVNHLRNREGTGHGRTLPSGVSEPVAYLVVREACSIVELMFASLDARLGAGR